MICGECDSFRADGDYPLLYGECLKKGRYVAYNALCDINNNL